MNLKTQSKLCAEECIGLQLRRSARAVARLYDRHLAAVGIRGTQFSLLNGVYLQAPVTMQELAESLNLDRTSLTRNLGPLVSAGWIVIETGSDRRTRCVSTTQQGTALLRQAMPYWRRAQAEAEALLGLPTPTSLRKTLQALERAGD